MSGLSHTAQHLVTGHGYLAIFLLMAVSAACIPFPSEVTLLVGGWYASTGRLSFFWVGLAGVAGSMVGSWAAYALGRTAGRAGLERYGKYLLIRTREIERAERWWEEHGEAATFFGRLIPVVRSFISLPAGIAEMGLVRFSAYTLVGVAIWSYGLAWAGYAVGHNWERVSGYLRVPTLVIAVVLVGALIVWVTQRRRRALRGS